MTLVASGCGDGEDANRLQRAEEDGRAAVLVGDTITVSGEVARVLSPDAFLIGGESLSLGSDEGTHVFAAGMVDVAEGGFVRVTGTVHAFVASNARQEIGVDVDEEDPLVVAYEEEYAIAATSVDFVPAGVVSSDDKAAFERALEAGTADQLVDHVLTVGGEVVERFGAHAVRVEAEDGGIGAVVIAVEPIEVDDLGYVRAIGTVEVFLVDDIETRYGIELDDPRLGRLEDDYALVATNLDAVPEDAVTE